MRISIALTLFLSLLSTCVHADEPSLAETLAWLDSTYNPHGDAGSGSVHGHGRKILRDKGVSVAREDATFSYDGCQFTLNYKDDPSSPWFSEVYAISVMSFNLRDIDPGSIKLLKFNSLDRGLECKRTEGSVCDIAVMQFQTRNESPLIDEEFSSFDHGKIIGHGAVKSKKYTSSFYLDDLQYAERFEKAFRHAIQLCGGKPSAF